MALVPIITSHRQERLGTLIWWNREGAKRKEILELVVKGRSIEDIVDSTQLSVEKIHDTVSNKYFLSALQAYMSLYYFTYQVQKVLNLQKVHQKLFKIVNDGEIDQKDAAKYLMQLYALKDKDPKIINPKQYNFIINLLGDKNVPVAPKSIEELQKIFGFSELGEEEDGSKPIQIEDPGLAGGESDQDEQGSAS